MNLATSYGTCGIFQKAFGCCKTPNAGQKMIIQFYCAKKLKKEEKSKKIEAKFSKKKFNFAPNAGQGFYSQKKNLSQFLGAN